MTSQRLRLADGIAVYVGIIFGSGIFFAPAAVASLGPNGAWLWVVGAVVVACGAACYAECGARLPRVGGFFAFFHESYGPGVAFVAGLVGFSVTYPASIAGMSLVCASYLQEVIGGGGSTAMLALVVIGVATALNVVGLKVEARAQRLLTATKVTALACLCVAALVAPSAPAVQAVAPVTLGPVLFAALLHVLWTYDGWSDVTLLAGELKDPGRTLGRTVALGTLLLLAIYGLVQLSVGHLLGGAAATSERVVADAVAQAFGPPGRKVVAVLVVISTFGAVHGVLFAASRLGVAMSGSGALPLWLGSESRQGTPRRSTLALATLTAMYAAFGTLQELLGLFSFAVWVFYALVAVALIRLRRRGAGEPPGFRAPFGWLTPSVIILTALGVSVSLAWDAPLRTGLGACVLFGSYALYRLRHR